MVSKLITVTWKDTVVAFPAKDEKKVRRYKRCTVVIQWFSTYGSRGVSQMGRQGSSQKGSTVAPR